MVTIISDLIDGYEKLFTERSNPLTRQWYLTGSPYLIPSIVTAYLIFCLKIGPWYMKNRQPFELNTAIKLHNFSQVLLSLYMLKLAAWRIFFTDYSLTCQQTDMDDKYFDIECKTCYIYLFAKLTELMDTVFFILRKSFRQVTFLHLFHHTIMPVGCWIGILYNPGGNGAVLGLFNTAVHVVMYSYYLLANFGDKYKKYLWWKKYVTVFQLVQFAIVGIHAFNSLFYSCGYPTILKLLVLTQSVFFFKMFSDFYVKTYWNKQPKKQANGVHENGKESNGVYKNGKESSNGVYKNGKESSNGIYENGKELSNGIYENGKESSNGVYKHGKESSNGIYENGKELSNGVYKNGKESYNGIYTNGKNKTH